MGNNLKNAFGWVILLSTILISGCQEPIFVGSELHEGDKQSLGFLDSFDISARTIAGDRLTTYRPGVDSRTYLLGQLNDNLFGKVTSELYLTCELQPSPKPNYHIITETVKFDSLVLVLKYDTLATYGSDVAAHRVEVFQLTKKILPQDTFYSDTNLSFVSPALLDKSLVVYPRDSVGYIDHVTRTVVKQAPHLRLKLDDRFGKLLLFDIQAAQNDTAFVNLLKGFYIKSTPLSLSSMYGFNFSTAALAEAQPVNKLIMYYTVGDTTRMEYQYLINTATVNKYVHNRTGSDADFFIKNPSRGDSLAFMQAMGGVKTVVSFKDLSSLSDKLINKVELDVFVFEPTNQQGTFSNPSQLIASRKNASGNIELIQDLAQLINSGVSFATVFKGQLNEEGTVRKYTMNITNHIKNAVKDKTYNSDLYIGILNEQESPRRVIFYGPKHKSNPMKLRVNYTKVQ